MFVKQQISNHVRLYGDILSYQSPLMWLVSPNSDSAKCMKLINALIVTIIDFFQVDPKFCRKQTGMSLGVFIPFYFIYFNFFAITLF